MSEPAPLTPEHRIAALEATLKANKQFDLAEKSFETVLEADIHIDNKASRILAAVAFLTAACSAIFAKAYNPVDASSPRGSMDIAGLDVSLLAFSTFLVFVLVGAIFYLAALGPSLNVSKRSGRQRQEIQSLLFFEFIGRVPRELWLKHWGWGKDTEGKPARISNGNLADSLTSQMEHNYLFEAHLIAEKIQTKMFFMTLGSFLFKAALVFLAPLIITLFYADGSWGLAALFFGLSILFLDLALEFWKRPPFELRRYHAAVILLLIAAVLFSLSIGKIAGQWHPQA